MATFDPKKLLKQSVESAKKNVSSSGGSRNTTVQQQAQNQSQPKSSNAWNPAEQVKQQIQGGTSQKSSSGQKKTQTQTQTQPKQVQQTVRRATDTIKATVQNAPTVQQQASQQTGETKRQTTQQRTPQQQVQQKAQSAYQSIVTALNAKDAVRNAPVTQQNAIDRGGQKVKQIAQYTVKGSDSKTNKSDEQKSFLRRVKEGINDIITNAPDTRTTGYQRSLGGRNIGHDINEFVNNYKANLALGYDMTDAEQEAIARARGASEEDIALAKRLYDESVNYMGRHLGGVAANAHENNRRELTTGMPIDSWLKFLPTDSKDFFSRTGNAIEAGANQHNVGWAGDIAALAESFKAKNPAIQNWLNSTSDKALQDAKYYELLAQQGLSGDNQNMYDRLIASAIQNGMTAGETSILGMALGMSPANATLRRLGLANMARGSYGSSYADVRTGGQGEQYTNDLGAARRYALANAGNELFQENLFKILGIREDKIPGADVFGVGDFIPEAIEEGVGAGLDPFSIASLDVDPTENPFEYLNRVGQIYAQQGGVAGTLENMKNAAIEGGLGGVLGGMMAHPSLSARQTGTDIQSYKNLADVVAEEIDGITTSANANPNQGMTLSYADSEGYDVRDTEDKHALLHKDDDDRQTATDNLSNALVNADDNNLEEISGKRFEDYKNSGITSKARATLLLEGGLMSTDDTTRHIAQRENDKTIRAYAKKTAAEITEDELQGIIAISNKIGVPVRILDSSDASFNDKRGYYNESLSKNRLRTGLITLPSKTSGKSYVETLVEIFLHEVAHVSEGSPEYFKLHDYLMHLDKGVFDEKGEYHLSENVVKNPDGSYSDKETGAVFKKSNKVVDDKKKTHGTEHTASMLGRFARDNDGANVYNALVNRDYSFLENDVNKNEKKELLGLSSDMLDVARWKKIEERLEQDPLGHERLQRAVGEVLRKGGVPLSVVPGYYNEDGSQMTVMDAYYYYLDGGRPVPYNGIREYQLRYANRNNNASKSNAYSDEETNYSYRQDLQKMGWSEKDIVEISDELFYYNEGEVFDKKAYDHLAEIDNRVKGKDFKTVKRMLDDFDLRETDYDDAEYAEQRENINDRYQDVDGLFREIGVSSSYSDKIAKDLKEKGDYNNYFFTRAVNSLANNKGITKDEARQQLYEIRDEYNKRHPEGLKKAEAKAEYIKKSDEASDNASFKRLMRQEQKEQRNASKNKKNSGKGGWKLAKNGVDLIKTDKDGNIIEIKRRDNKQSKSDQDVFNSVVMGEKTKDQNAKEVKEEEPKVEKVKEETPVEEKKVEEKKEETPKEETAKAEAPVEPTQQVEEQKEEQPAQKMEEKEETLSEERRQDLDTLAYFRNQEIENANLPSGMERVQRKADTEETTAPKEKIQKKSRIGKADTEVSSMDTHEMMKYFRQEEWEGSDVYNKKTNEERDSIDDELDTLVEEVENPKTITREEGEVHNTLAAILYRAGGKLEHVNSLAKTYEETGKIKGRRDVERDILEAHKNTEDGKFKDSASAEEFVRRVVTAWKNSTQASQELSQEDFTRATGLEAVKDDRTGYYDFVKSKEENGKQEPATLQQNNTNWTAVEGTDTFNVSNGETEKEKAKTESYKKAQEINTKKTAEAKTEAVSKIAKDVRGKDFTVEQKKTITDANVRAEQIRQEKAERSQAKAEEYVRQKAEQTKPKTEQSAQNQSNKQQETKTPTEEEIRKAGEDRLKYAEDFSESQTSKRMDKEKFYDEGLRARIDESHKIKGVKHDKEVMADAKKWRDESGLGGVTAYAEGKNLQNNPMNTEEEELYLIEGLKDLSRLSSDIRKNIERLEKNGGKGSQEALSQLRDEQKSAMDSAVTVFEAIWNGGSEAGRALRAMRYLYETPELIPTYMQRKVDQLNREYEKKLKGRKITLNQELMDKISDPNISDKERDELWEKVNYDIGDQLPRTLKGRMTQWRKTGMLLNPRTHIRNYASNVLTYGMFGINDTIQAGIENAVLNSKALQKALNVEYTEADRRSSAGRIGKEYHDVAKWLDELHEFSKEAPGSGKFNIFEGISEAGAFSNNNVVGKTLNDISRWNNKWLEKEDRTFVQKRARQALAGMLKAQGYTVTKTETGYDITKGTGENAKKIDSKVLEAIEREALKNAQEATYHDFNRAAKAIENLKKNLGPAGYAIDIVVPFTKTPANIMHRSLEFSPAGLAWTLTHDLAKVRSGDMSASTYVTRLSRGLTGTVAFIAGAVLANMGVLSKPDDDDDEARSSYYRENIFGKQDLAVHVGDRYYSIEWAMPTAAPIMMGASMADEFAKHGLNILDYDIKELLKDGASAINPVLEASYLGSLSDLINSYSQGNAYGGNIMPAGTLGGIDRAASSIIENLAGQMVPTVGGAINRTFDSTKRTTSGNTMGERMMNKALMNLPFHSNLLQPAIDEKGNEIENVGAVFGNNLFGRAVYNFIMPMTITEDKHDELDSALMDIGKDALPRNQTGSGGLKGQILADLDKAGLSLADISGEEYTEVKKTYYGNYRQYAKDYNELAEYNNLGTHTRDAVYKKIEQLALNEAKATYYDKVGDVNDLYTEEQKAALSLKEYGVSPAQFFLIKDCGLSGNRKALYVMSELERLGVADEVVDDILHQKYFPSAVGLTDSIVVKTPDEREAAREKYLVDDDYETLESKVAAYRAMSKEEYEAKKDKDAEESREDSWEDFFKKYDKKYGTNYSAAFANKDGKGGNSSKGSGKKGKSGGSKRSSKGSKQTKEKAQKQYTPRTYSRRGRSGGGGGGSSTPDDQALFDMFMKMASSGLRGNSSSKIKASVDLSSDAKLWDTIVNGSKKDVEKLRKELKL